MSKKYLLLTLALSLFVAANGQKVDLDKLAFKYDEQLNYVVSYKVGLINTEIATVVFNTKKSTFANKTVFHVNAVAQVSSSYRWFFDMRDEYNTWMDEATLKPLYFNNNIKEGSYRFYSSIRYDWNKNIGYSEYRNPKFEKGHVKEQKIGDQTFDGLALFFNLRNIDLQDITAGYKGYINLVTADTTDRIEYKFIGREVKSIPSVGKFNTLKFSCQLASDEAFKDGSEFFIWFSDDLNKIPLYIESPIRVGSIKGRINSWKNLNHPLSSKIN